MEKDEIIEKYLYSKYQEYLELELQKTTSVHKQDFELAAHIRDKEITMLSEIGNQISVVELLLKTHYTKS